MTEVVQDVTTVMLCCSYFIHMFESIVARAAGDVFPVVLFWTNNTWILCQWHLTSLGSLLPWIAGTSGAAKA